MATGRSALERDLHSRVKREVSNLRSKETSPMTESGAAAAATAAGAAAAAAAAAATSPVRERRWTPYVGGTVTQPRAAAYFGPRDSDGAKTTYDPQYAAWLHRVEIMDMIGEIKDLLGDQKDQARREAERVDSLRGTIEALRSSADREAWRRQEAEEKAAGMGDEVRALEERHAAEAAARAAAESNANEYMNMFREARDAWLSTQEILKSKELALAAAEERVRPDLDLEPLQTLLEEAKKAKEEDHRMALALRQAMEERPLSSSSPPVAPAAVAATAAPASTSAESRARRTSYGNIDVHGNAEASRAEPTVGTVLTSAQQAQRQSLEPSRIERPDEIEEPPARAPRVSSSPSRNRMVMDESGGGGGDSPHVGGGVLAARDVNSPSVSPPRPVYPRPQEEKERYEEEEGEEEREHEEQEEEAEEQKGGEQEEEQKEEQAGGCVLVARDVDVISPSVSSSSPASSNPHEEKDVYDEEGEVEVVEEEDEEEVGGSDKEKEREEEEESLGGGAGEAEQSGPPPVSQRQTLYNSGSHHRYHYHPNSEALAIVEEGEDEQSTESGGDGGSGSGSNGGGDSDRDGTTTGDDATRDCLRFSVPGVICASGDGGAAVDKENLSEACVADEASASGGAGAEEKAKYDDVDDVDPQHCCGTQKERVIRQAREFLEILEGTGCSEPLLKVEVDIGSVVRVMDEKAFLQLHETKEGVDELLAAIASGGTAVGGSPCAAHTEGRQEGPVCR